MTGRVVETYAGPIVPRRSCPAMIVCHCNVLSDRDLKAALDVELAVRPRTAGQLYKCLGCRPECGRCLPTIQKLMADHAGCAVRIGCPTCPGHAMEPVAEAPLLVAAE
ncbi:(2Fe-2S)-binding protein [Prosthecomicrobium sp. N25]|uniref:(2Fe-2S)-binding protein n=1 Tax=Prosthecomicrobium sp. N25 TaxID=3129254 RepID=UPI003077C689